MAIERKIVEVHVSTISIGDSVIGNDGFERTVGKGNIKQNTFIGTTIFGDNYQLGNLPIKKVIYKKKDITYHKLIMNDKS